MPLLQEQEKEKELIQIRDFLDEMEIAAEVMPKNGLVESACLLIGLPTDEELEMEEEDLLPEDAHLAACYLVQLSDAQDQNTKYLMLYFMVPQELSGADELAVLRIINDMNQTVSMGGFVFGETQGMKGPEKHVQYKVTVGAGTDGFWDEGVLVEMIIEAGMYYDMMKERLAELSGQ